MRKVKIKKQIDMKKISLITLLTLMMVSFQSVAQGKTTVLITIIKSGKDITLQVVKPDYTVNTENFKFKEEEPDEMILKREMDKWLNEGYNLSDTYVYNISKQYSGNTSSFTTYVNYILIKKEE
jgi:hypothetical protein